MKTFYTSLKIGEQGEKHFEEYLANNPQVKRFKKMHHIDDFRNKDYEYDYQLQMQDGRLVACEIKTLAGGNRNGPYPTAVIEIYKNSYKQRPGWYRSVLSGVLHYVVFISMAHKEMYFFDANKLKDFVDKVDENNYTKANDGNMHANGDIVKVRWTDTSAGFKYRRKL